MLLVPHRQDAVRDQHAACGLLSDPEERGRGAAPKIMHYRSLHVPAVIVHCQRRRRLKIPASWPWAE